MKANDVSPHGYCANLKLTATCYVRTYIYVHVGDATNIPSLKLLFLQMAWYR